MEKKFIGEVREIFYVYRKNKMIIDNYEIIKNVYSDELTIKELEKCKNYISLVDGILDELDSGDSWILRNLYIEKKDKYDLHYSISTFYWRLRRASANFMEFLKW